jgi:heme/copper-type cytochrome/quinol oxidase subunit 3
MTGKSMPPVPRRTATIAMLLFLASLSILFLSSLFGYFFIRLHNRDKELHFPPLLWASTVAIVASSITMSMALRSVKRERLPMFRLYLLLTVVLTVLFVVIQTPALAGVMRTHWASSPSGNTLYGLVFVLILLHAVHVLGGLIGLGRVVYGAYRDRYDHESYVGVQNVTWYWHFLDIVWLIIFLSMSAVG